jgi:hypothetical protein
LSQFQYQPTLLYNTALTTQPYTHIKSCKFCKIEIIYTSTFPCSISENERCLNAKPLRD